MTDLRTGIDLGGTKIEIVVLGRDGGAVLRRRVATPAGDYGATLEAIAGLVSAAATEIGTPVERLGVGTPGSLSPASGLMRNANSTCLNGHPLDRDLARATGCEIRLENDANCFALAEAQSGAGQGAGVVFGVIAGTGVGGGIVVDGRLLTGANGIGGEWGHNPLPGRGDDEDAPPACYCGRFGCIEAWCSGPALAQDHARQTGMDVAAAEIAGLAQAGDLEAAETLRRHRARLARALASVINILDPDAIVLGGGLSNLPGLAEGLQEDIGPHVFSDSFKTPILKNRLGDSAGVLGAAQLWPWGE